MREFLIFLEEIRELLLMIEEDKDFTYLTEVIERVEDDVLPYIQQYVPKKIPRI